MSTVLKVNNRVRLADSGWLMLAVGLHALLLLLPVSKLTTTDVRKGAEIVVQLLFPDESVAPDSLPAEPAESVRAIRATPDAVADGAVPAPGPDLNLQVPAPRQDDVEPEPDVNTARLMDSRHKLFEAVPGPVTEPRQARRLGTPLEHAMPPNWRRGAGAAALAPFDNLLGEAVAPADVEIVDRWLAADGSHNVIIETPNGLRMCGRALAWDPIQPLVEHVMLFHVCGGDRRDDFEFVPRERFDHYYLAPVAKDTTEP